MKDGFPPPYEHNCRTWVPCSRGVLLKRVVNALLIRHNEGTGELDLESVDVEYGDPLILDSGPRHHILAMINWC